MNATEVVNHVGEVLEELGFLEESIQFGRARWVLLADTGQTSSITLTIEDSGDIRVVVAIERVEGDGNLVEITSAGSVNRGIIADIFPGTGKLTMTQTVEFVTSYARLLAFRPSSTRDEERTREIPPTRLRQV